MQLLSVRLQAGWLLLFYIVHVLLLLLLLGCHVICSGAAGALIAGGLLHCYTLLLLLLLLGLDWQQQLKCTLKSYQPLLLRLQPHLRYCHRNSRHFRSIHSAQLQLQLCRVQQQRCNLRWQLHSKLSK
jgi:hypothetical protein